MTAQLVRSTRENRWSANDSPMPPAERFYCFGNCGCGALRSDVAAAGAPDADNGRDVGTDGAAPEIAIYKTADVLGHSDLQCSRLLPDLCMLPGFQGDLCPHDAMSWQRRSHHLTDAMKVSSAAMCSAVLCRLAAGLPPHSQVVLWQLIVKWVKPASRAPSTSSVHLFGPMP